MDLEYRRTKLWRILEDVCYNTHPCNTDAALRKAEDLKLNDDSVCNELYNAIYSAYHISHINLLEQGFRNAADKIVVILDKYREYDK